RRRGGNGGASGAADPHAARPELPARDVRRAGHSAPPVDRDSRRRLRTMAVAVERKVQYKDLREYLTLLEGAGLLARVTGEVDLKHEIGAICAHGLERSGPGLAFENVKGYPGKVLVSNIIYSVEQLALIFNSEPDVDKIYEAIVVGHRNRVPSVVLDWGPCKEEKFVGDAVDLYELPTPWWHELDGGQYIATAAGI